MVTEKPSPDPGIREIENAWIPLADGTRLAARIWMPADAYEAPVPAILEYLPYRKSDGTVLADLGRHPFFAAHGYASVRVDLRGTGDSDGLLRGEYLPQEQDDALEVLAWLESQPWCSGAVGMIGYSWGGFNGLQIAARRPAQLKAVISVASTDDRYLDDCHYMGGCLLGSDMLKWASSMLIYALQPPSPRLLGPRWRKMWLQRLQEAPELARDWIVHQLRDDFWEHGSVAEDYEAIACPVMVVGGWADAYTNAVPRLLENLKVPRLGIIGPWAHMMPHEGVPGPAVDFLREAVRWWDCWLKGADSSIMDEPLLRAWLQDYVHPAPFHALRPGRWIAEERWPPVTVEPRPFVLRRDGGLALKGGSGGDSGEIGARVSIRGRQECGATAGVWCANGYPDEIAGDQAADDACSLCFDTEPLAEDLEILGHPIVKLHLAADRPMALIAARVEDVDPDGASLLVSWGMLNLTHRDGHTAAEPLEVGRAYDVTVECRVCGHRIPAGHRVRLALSPTYWPHAWPSPEPATPTIICDGPSALLLPIRSGARPAAPEQTSLVEVPVPCLPAAGRRDERSREIRVDRDALRHEIVDREMHERTIPGSGARYSEAATDIYGIVEGDPLSATVRCRRETSSIGPEEAWRIVLLSEMTCSAEGFQVSEEYAAFERDEQVFVKTRQYRIPRRGA